MIRLGTLLGLVCSLLAADDGLGSVDVVSNLLSGPLGVDFEFQTDLPTLEHVDFTMGIRTFLENQRFRSQDGFESVLGLSRAPFGSSWGSLGSSLGPLDRPNRASRFVLELSWAWFARFLLPKMALGASWGCFWLVLGAPEGL